MTAFAAFATLVCQKNSVFLCKGTKLQNSAKQNSGRVCRFSLWNVFPPLKPAFFFPNSAPLNSGLWLGAFGKVWLFRCQSGIRGLWLTAFDKSEFFRCQSTFATGFCQKNSVFLCKGTKLQKATLFALFCKAEFLDSMPVDALELGTLFPNSAQAEFGALARGFW